MSRREFHIKNMVSRSCIKLIEVYFDRIDAVKIVKVFLGLVILEYDKTLITSAEIEAHFETIGFRVAVNPDVILVEQIKVAAIELIYFSNNANSLIRNSDYISERVQQPYSKISRVFSYVTATTLEKYIILLKIEKTKELLIHNELSLSEIAYQLGYSSVQYLSNQFKKITGFTVSQYRDLENKPGIVYSIFFSKSKVFL
jgi:AraC-like DNA-binding protein/copper chaperone CopZ